MKDILKDLRFNHIGLVLKHDKDALVMVESLGYGIGEGIYDPLQNVYVRQCSTPTERAAAEILSLPMYPELTPDQVQAVSAVRVGLPA